MELNKIYNENCLEGIQRIDEKSIQTIICDSPYFQGLNCNGKKGDFSDLNISSCFFEKLFTEFARVLTEGGCVYFFCDWRSYAFYYPLLDEIIGCDNMLVWDKKSGPGNFYSYMHELIIFHTNNRKFKGKSNIIRDIPGFAAGAKKEDGEKKHPAQKPTALIRKLIQDSTRPNDIVLDCFIGSGTTAIAALQTNRKYIGFEINRRYFCIANERIEKLESK